MKDLVILDIDLVILSEWVLSFIVFEIIWDKLRILLISVVWVDVVCFIMLRVLVILFILLIFISVKLVYFIMELSGECSLWEMLVRNWFFVLFSFFNLLICLLSDVFKFSV